MRFDSIREGTVLALDQLRANRSRSALTILGIVVGVAVVMAVSAMISGIRTGIINAVLSSGPQNFLVMRFDPNAPRDANAHGPPWGRNPRVTLDEAARIAQLSKLQAAIPRVNANGEVSYGRERLTDVRILGDGDQWLEVAGGELIAGHNYTHADAAAGRAVAVVTPDLARDLLGPVDPVGKRIRIAGQQFEIVGVYQPPDAIFAAGDKHLLRVPVSAAMKYLSADDEMLVVMVRPRDGMAQEEAMDQVTILLRTMRGLRPGAPNDFALVRMEEFVNTFNRITAIFFIVMIALSSVGLMVGGVGVIAIMMIAVTERTREIGIRKALGATQREILFQFLVEAATVTLIGTAIGMLLGGAVALAVATLSPIPARVPFGAVIAALAMAVVAGVLFGLWPAWRAARLYPVEALRYE